MAVKEFTGDLDPVNVKEFTGRLDQEKKDTGFTGATKAGYQRLKGDIAALAGRTGLMDPDVAEEYRKERIEEAEAIFEPTQEGWTEAPIQKFKETLGGSLPYMAAPVVAGVGVATLPVTGPTATALGLGAAGLASAAQFTGSNISRQLQEDPNLKLKDTDLMAAGAAAVPQAALDTLSLRLMPGIGRIFGAAGKEITPEVAKKIVEQNVLKTVGDYTLRTGRTAGLEGTTEAAQQLFERLQAGLSITDEKARDEYFESFIGGAVLGGTLGAPGTFVERGVEQGKARKVLAEEERARQVELDALAEEEAALLGPEGVNEVYADEADRLRVEAFRDLQARKQSKAYQKLDELAKEAELKRAEIDAKKAAGSAFSTAELDEQGNVIVPKEKEEIAGLLPYQPTIKPYFVFPDGSVATSSEAAFAAKYAPQLSTEGVNEVLSKFNAMPDIPEVSSEKITRFGFVPEGDSSVKVTEGEKVTRKDGSEWLKYYDDSGKKSFRKMDKVMVDPTEEDIIQLEYDNAMKTIDFGTNEFANWLTKQGVKADQMMDVLGESKKNKNKVISTNNDKRKLFRPDGQQLDELATRARDSGFMTQADIDAAGDVGGVRKLTEMIQDAFRGEVVVTPKMQDAYAQVDQLEEAFRQRRALIKPQPTPTEADLAPLEGAELEADILAQAQAVPQEQFVPEGAPVAQEISAETAPLEMEYKQAVEQGVLPEPKAEMRQPQGYYTDKFIAEGETLAKNMRASLDKMGLKGVGLNLEDSIYQLINGRMTEVNGNYFDKLIQVSLSGDNILRTLNHESIHAMRELGFFSDADWKMLSDMATKQWLQKYNVKQRYPNLSQEERIEEAIADAFADRQTQPPVVKSIIAKALDMLKRIGNVLRGRGFRIADDIFAEAAEGKLKQTEPVEVKAPAKQKTKEPLNAADRKEAFDAWFGDSKIVNPDGTPMVLYHGTRKDFNEFKPGAGAFGYGVYLTGMPDRTKLYWGGFDKTPPKGGNILPLYVRMINPKIYQGGEKEVLPTGMVRHSPQHSKYITEQAKQEGYDGIVIKNPDGTIWEAVAFEPNQLKSATGNIGEFNIQDNDIRADRADSFAKWFGNSKVVDKNGAPRVMYHGTATDITKFSPNQFFTFSPKAANSYALKEEYEQGARFDGESEGIKGANILPVYIKAENIASADDVLNTAKKLGLYDQNAEDSYLYTSSYTDKNVSDAVINDLKKQGFDSIFHYDYDLDGNRIESLQVFNPGNIKSSTGNVGDFSQADADIRAEIPAWSERDEPNQFGRETTLTSMYKRMQGSYDESFSPDEAFESAYEQATKEEQYILRQLKKDGMLGFDYPHQAVLAIIQEPTSFDLSPQLKTAISRLGNKSVKETKQPKAEIPTPKRLKADLSNVNPDVAKRIIAQFTQTPATIQEKFKQLRPNMAERLIQGLFDEFRSIKKYSNEAYMKSVLSKSTDGALEGLLYYGQVELDNGALNIKKGTKGLLDILEPLGKEVDQYQIWKALNRDARMPADKRSFQDLIGYRDELVKGEINGVPRKQVYETALKEENALNRSVLDIAKAQGIIDDEAYARFASDIYYIPFYSEMEDGQVGSVNASSKLTGQYFSKKLKGGEKKTNDLMENVLMNWSHILSASMKNAAAQSTLKAAADLGAAEKVKQTTVKGVTQYYVTEDGERRFVDKKDVVKIMEKGNEVAYSVTDPDLVDSISLISYLGPKSPFLDVAKGFTNALRYGVTLSPAYKIRNLMRDSVQAAAVSPIGMNIMTNVYNGLKLSDRGNPTFMSALVGGGVFEMGVAHEGDQAKMIKRLIDKGVNYGTILDTPEKIKGMFGKALDWYNEQGNRFENANRLTLYQKLIDEGKTHLEASFAARDLMNFSSQGSFRAVKVLSQVVPFFNARLQGLYKLGRDGITPTYRLIYNTATGKPIEASDKIKAQSFMVVSSAVMLASTLLYLTFKDDEDFQRREDWDRDNFWWFKINDVQYRIPKPFEIGALGTIAERTIEQVMDENVEGKVFANRMHSILSDTFSLNPIPQFAKPLIDLYANKDSFTGAPIESAGLERLSKQERYTDSTSALAKALGGISQAATRVLTMSPEAEGMSPVQVDYAVKAYLGWLGGTAASVSDKAVQPWSEVEKPGKPLIDTVGMGFIKTMPETQSKFATAFYDNNKKINQAFADMKRYTEIGDLEKVAEIYEKKGDLITLQKMYDKTSKSLAEYRKYIQMITRDPSMSKEEKELEIARTRILISETSRMVEEVRKASKKQ